MHLRHIMYQSVYARSGIFLVILLSSFDNKVLTYLTLMLCVCHGDTYMYYNF